MRVFVLLICLALGACAPKLKSSINAPAASPLTFGELPEVSLIDATGAAVSPARLRGSAWVLTLLSRPLRFQSRNMNAALMDLSVAIAGTDSRLVSLSMDPLNDTPGELLAYREESGADGDTWMLWTGDEPAVYRVVQAAYHAALVGLEPAEMRAAMQRSFEQHVVVIDVKGRVRGAYDLSSEDGPKAVLERLRAVSRE